MTATTRVRLRLPGPPGIPPDDPWGRKHLDGIPLPAGDTGPWVVEAVARADLSDPTLTHVAVTYAGETHRVAIDDDLTAPMTCAGVGELRVAHLRLLRQRLQGVVDSQLESSVMRQVARAMLGMLDPGTRRQTALAALDAAIPAAGQSGLQEGTRVAVLALVGAVLAMDLGGGND